MSWTDEEREEVIKQYKDSKPTAENSNDIVKEISDNMDKTVNGVRSILVRAEVYIKKEVKKSEKKESSSGTRVNKTEAIDALKELLESNSLTVDAAIIDKLTGKAAVYFTDTFKVLTQKEA